MEMPRQMSIHCQYHGIFVLFRYSRSHLTAHWSSGQSVRQRSGRPGFNPRSGHTKDFKNGT